MSFRRQHPRAADVPNTNVQLQLWREGSREGSGRDAIVPLVLQRDCIVECGMWKKSAFRNQWLGFMPISRSLIEIGWVLDFTGRFRNWLTGLKKSE